MTYLWPKCWRTPYGIPGCHRLILAPLRMSVRQDVHSCSYFTWLRKETKKIVQHVSMNDSRTCFRLQVDSTCNMPHLRKKDDASQRSAASVRPAGVRVQTGLKRQGSGKRTSFYSILFESELFVKEQLQRIGSTCHQRSKACTLGETLCVFVAQSLCWSNSRTLWLHAVLVASGIRLDVFATEKQVPTWMTWPAFASSLLDFISGF